MFGEFSFERREIAVDQIVATGDEREIAIPAAMAAERNVDVGGANCTNSAGETLA